MTTDDDCDVDDIDDVCGYYGDISSLQQMFGDVSFYTEIWFVFIDH